MAGDDLVRCSCLHAGRLHRVALSNEAAPLSSDRADHQPVPSAGLRTVKGPVGDPRDWCVAEGQAKGDRDGRAFVGTAPEGSCHGEPQPFGDRDGGIQVGVTQDQRNFSPP